MRIDEIIAETPKDAADEDDRVFLAYCDRHSIKLKDLDDEEVLRHYTRALADRHQYPIPVSEPEFLYHGIDKKNLPEIAQQGLTPSGRPNSRHPDIIRHSTGRVFFTDTIRSALFYALRAAGRKPKVILRVRRNHLDDAQPDSWDEEAVFVERAVPASHIEVWNGHAWQPLAE